MTYPTASITLNMLGAPAVGNAAFAQLLLGVVGRGYRAVHALDLVPAIPPLDEYVGVAAPFWLTDDDMLLQV